MSRVRNINGALVEFEYAVPLMDDELRESIHASLSPCSEQEFYTAYEQAHFKKYLEDFICSKIAYAW